MVDSQLCKPRDTSGSFVLCFVYDASYGASMHSTCEVAGKPSFASYR